MKDHGKTNRGTDETVRSLQQRLQSGEPLSAQMLAISRAGHDKGGIFVVLAEDGEYLWLADGRRRTLAAPKKKKQMHVQLVRHLPKELLAQMQEIRLDAHLRKIIEAYGGIYVKIGCH